MLTGQVTTLRSKWSNASNDNMRLQAELGTLRKTLQVLLASSHLYGYCCAPDCCASLHGVSANHTHYARQYWLKPEMQPMTGICQLFSIGGLANRAWP